VVAMLYAQPDRAFFLPARRVAAALLPVGVPVPPVDLGAVLRKRQEGTGAKRQRQDEEGVWDAIRGSAVGGAHGKPLNLLAEALVAIKARAAATDGSG